MRVSLMSSIKVLPGRNQISCQAMSLLSWNPASSMRCGAARDARRYRGDVPSGFGRLDFDYIPKRRVDQYPIPTDATHWLSHQKPQYCTTFMQEMSAYQTKVFWTYYMHTAGRLWNRFACCWWSWAWPATVCMGTIFIMALRNQRIERVRTWH